MCRVPSGPICIATVRRGAERTDINTLFMLLPVERVIQPPDSDPWVSCPLLSSVKLWHTSLLACKQNKISDPSQFSIPATYKAFKKQFTPIFISLSICLPTYLSNEDELRASDILYSSLGQSCIRQPTMKLLGWKLQSHCTLLNVAMWN